MTQPLRAIGPYRLVRKLGEGGMGEVFEAVHTTIERQVAIKILRSPYARDPSVSQRCVNEARAVNIIKHPGIVQISDIGQLDDHSPYIVMEYLHGETLGQRLARSPTRLPLSQVLHISWQVASALVAAHDVGIVHRDLKPDNLMLVADPIAPNGERAKLLDFGIARFDAALYSNLASTGGRVMGTPTYMSPEQCRGMGPIDAKSDVYSLGVMLFQLLAGRPPFVSEGIGELLHLHMTEEPPALMALAPQTPPALAAFVHQMLTKVAAQRPTMRQVLAAIEQLQAGPLEPLPSAESQAPQLSSFGLSDRAISDSLANLLGPEIEDEEAVDPEDQPSPSRTDSEAATVVLAEHKAESVNALQTQPASRPAPSSVRDSRSTRSGGGMRWRLAVFAALAAGGIALLSSRILSSPASAPRGAPRIANSTAVQVLAPNAVAPQPAVDVASPTVSWSIDSDPSGAHVLRGDTNEDLGVTPWHAEHPRRDGSLVVRLRHPDYVGQELRLDYRQSSQQRVSLIQMPRPIPFPPEPRRTQHPQRLALPTASPSQKKAPNVPTKPVFEVIE